MEAADHSTAERKQVLRTLVRNLVLQARALGQPMLLHIPDEDIPDTPIDEFEKGIEEFCKE